MAAPVLGPVPPSQRIEVIDVLRGWAVFGILLVNMQVFSGPGDPLREELWTGTAERATMQLILFLADSKFWTLFSFLFGLGFALQMGRAEARGAPFLPLYLRRLAVLLVIGLLHAFLLWTGDVLHIYALLGFLLLLFRTCSARTILLSAFLCLWIPVVHAAIVAAPRQLRRADPPLAQPVTREDTQQEQERRARQEENLRVYSQGNYAEMTAKRARFWTRQYSSVDYYLNRFGEEFVLFLLGLYAGRRRILENLQEHLPLVRKVLRWGFALGLVCTGASVLASEFAPPGVLVNILGDMLWRVGAPALSFFYASAILLLFQQTAWQRRLAPLAAVGRTALSNYLLQSVTCTTIFYSYGFGLYGRIGQPAGVALTFLIFAVQIPLSAWWLRHFRFGPVEWLWRTLTYGKLQPMRLEPIAAA